MSETTAFEGIGTLNEGSLHIALKDLVAEAGDEFEVPLDGFVIDIKRGTQLIEIQTTSFGAMGRKLDRLLPQYRIHLVHPIATDTWIVRDGMKRRKSPKRQTVYNLFDELVSVPTLLDHPNLTLEIVLIHQEKHRIPDPKARRGRGGWRTVDRHLTEIVGRTIFTDPMDLMDLMPDGLAKVWTTADLASLAGIPRSQAQAMCYCLKANELIVAGRRTRIGIEYTLG